MSKKQKLWDKIVSGSTSKKIKLSEAESLLNEFGYRRIEGRGSRLKFYNEEIEDVIILHKPHPGNELRIYVVNDIRDHLLKYFKKPK